MQNNARISLVLAFKDHLQTEYILNDSKVLGKKPVSIISSPGLCKLPALVNKVGKML